MDTFKMFLTLPRITQRRIIRQAREFAALTHNRIDFFSIAENMTVTAYDLRRGRQQERESAAQYRWQERG
jgi:hypothetical protein